MAIEVIAKIKQKNNADFFLIDAEDVELDGRSLIYSLPVILTQAEYDALVNADEVDPQKIYMIAKDEE